MNTYSACIFRTRIHASLSNQNAFLIGKKHRTESNHAGGTNGYLFYRARQHPTLLARARMQERHRFPFAHYRVRYTAHSKIFPSGGSRVCSAPALYTIARARAAASHELSGRARDMHRWGGQFTKSDRSGVSIYIGALYVEGHFFIGD